MAVLAVPALYLLAALIGSLVPVNRGWTEPDRGTTIYLADNGIHADIVMPVEAQGLDWRPLIPTISPRPTRAHAGSHSDLARRGSIWKRRAGATSSRAPSGRR